LTIGFETFNHTVADFIGDDIKANKIETFIRAGSINSLKHKLPPMKRSIKLFSFTMSSQFTSLKQKDIFKGLEFFKSIGLILLNWYVRWKGKSDKKFREKIREEKSLHYRKEVELR